MPEAWPAQYVSGIPGREKDPEERSVKGLDLLACGSTRPGHRGQRHSHLKEEWILRQCCRSWASKSYPSIWVWPRNTQRPKQKFNKVVSPLGLAAKHAENTKLPWWFETLSRFSCSFFFFLECIPIMLKGLGKYKIILELSVWANGDPMPQVESNAKKILSSGTPSAQASSHSHASSYNDDLWTRGKNHTEAGCVCDSQQSTRLENPVMSS